MPTYDFLDDYSEGIHPNIIDALTRTNFSQQKGYSNDEFCEDARKLLREKINAPGATVHFVPSGTAANLILIASCLRPHEAIIATSSGHIATKEAGAIEATGHKIIITEPTADGKLTPESIRSVLDRNSIFAHQAKPRMAYISNATEVGTVYTRRELADLSAVCRSLDLLLLMDGARLGTALACPTNDMSLNEIYNLTDFFWIGGTKNGALLGEAVVIKDQCLGQSVPYHIKQRGALLAKGRVLGIQFLTLFHDDLFFRLARHANNTAAKISTSLVKLGFKLWIQTETNQVFPVLPPALVQELQKSFNFYIWKYQQDGFLVIRLVTSWATEMVEVDRFCAVADAWTKSSR